MYSIKEMYYTLQGEGAQSGRPAVFIRFSGCNLWSGREADRASAVCKFCDTDFVGTDGINGGQFKDGDVLAATARSLAPANQSLAPTNQSLAPANHALGLADQKNLLVVLTGGEPLLQVDAALITALKNEGFIVAVETNGTIKAPEGLDWICVSPKAGSRVVQKSGN